MKSETARTKFGATTTIMWMPKNRNESTDNARRLSVAVRVLFR